MGHGAGLRLLSMGHEAWGGVSVTARKLSYRRTSSVSFFLQGSKLGLGLELELELGLGLG